MHVMKQCVDLVLPHIAGHGKLATIYSPLPHNTLLASHKYHYHSPSQIFEISLNKLKPWTLPHENMPQVLEAWTKSDLLRSVLQSWPETVGRFQFSPNICPPHLVLDFYRLKLCVYKKIHENFIGSNIGKGGEAREKGLEQNANDKNTARVRRLINFWLRLQHH